MFYQLLSNGILLKTTLCENMRERCLIVKYCSVMMGVHEAVQRTRYSEWSHKFCCDDTRGTTFQNGATNFINLDNTLQTFTKEIPQTKGMKELACNVQTM